MPARHNKRTLATNHMPQRRRGDTITLAHPEKPYMQINGKRRHEPSQLDNSENGSKMRRSIAQARVLSAGWEAQTYRRWTVNWCGRSLAGVRWSWSQEQARSTYPALGGSQKKVPGERRPGV